MSVSSVGVSHLVNAGKAACVDHPPPYCDRHLGAGAADPWRLAAARVRWTAEEIADRRFPQVELGEG
ncbi:hypothetical protein ADK38_21140 [Streptomyces varsoviensis]|uniref:Uncharacterized protein n=1 Tax=Streptomyces varsoviensis TaxID=67373 RepID=A0ABR5J460_9ACTN|nr:hypothetical protein ADK38_21140 [Streptomyces varsoviensis]